MHSIHAMRACSSSVRDVRGTSAMDAKQAAALAAAEIVVMNGIPDERASQRRTGGHSGGDPQRPAMTLRLHIHLMHLRHPSHFPVPEQPQRQLTD